FSYFRLYFGGDICRVHSDRPACEVSISLTLAYSDGLSWDLAVAEAPAAVDRGLTEDFGREPFRSFAMEPGHALLYYGSSFRHGRPTANPNRWSAHLSLDWVL